MMRLAILVSLLLASTSSAAWDALHEVNAARMKRGLRPFIYDPELARAAAGCADWRAARLVEGHTVNDFAALPPGTYAQASGCAAWHPRLGWGACDTYSNYTYCGAAWTMGRDGRRYCHLFVR